MSKLGYLIISVIIASFSVNCSGSSSSVVIDRDSTARSQALKLVEGHTAKEAAEAFTGWFAGIDSSDVDYARQLVKEVVNEYGINRGNSASADSFVIAIDNWSEELPPKEKARIIALLSSTPEQAAMISNTVGDNREAVVASLREIYSSDPQLLSSFNNAINKN